MRASQLEHLLLLERARAGQANELLQLEKARAGQAAELEAMRTSHSNAMQRLDSVEKRQSSVELDGGSDSGDESSKDGSSSTSLVSPMGAAAVLGAGLLGAGPVYLAKSGSNGSDEDEDEDENLEEMRKLAELVGPGLEAKEKKKQKDKKKEKGGDRKQGQKAKDTTIDDLQARLSALQTKEAGGRGDGGGGGADKKSKALIRNVIKNRATQERLLYIKSRVRATDEDAGGVFLTEWWVRVQH